MTIWEIVAAFVEEVRRALAKSRRSSTKKIAVTPFKRLKTREKGPYKELVYKGRSQRITAWAVEVGLPHMLVRKRLHAGWTVERALETPSLGGNDQRRAMKPRAA